MPQNEVCRLGRRSVAVLGLGTCAMETFCRLSFPRCLHRMPRCHHPPPPLPTYRYVSGPFCVHLCSLPPQHPIVRAPLPRAAAQAGFGSCAAVHSHHFGRSEYFTSLLKNAPTLSGERYFTEKTGGRRGSRPHRAKWLATRAGRDVWLRAKGVRVAGRGRQHRFPRRVGKQQQQPCRRSTHRRRLPQGGTAACECLSARGGSASCNMHDGC